MKSIFYQLAKWMGLSEDDDFAQKKYIGIADALSLPPVWYAHNRIVGDVGLLPLDIKKASGEGAENDYRHPSYKLFREAPNSMQSPSLFKEQVASHAIMFGNGRAAIVRDQSGTPVELIPIMPDRTVTVIVDGIKYHVTKPDMDSYENLMYDFSVNTDKYVILEDKDVLHITGFSHNGVTGMGLLNIGQDLFSIGKRSQTYVDTQLGKGFRGKLFIEAPAGMFREESKAREFLQHFNETEAGADNAGKAAMLREGMKVNAVSVTNQDSQFIELQKFTRQDVGMLFGIEAMPGDPDGSSYNGHEQKNLAYLVALDRWLVKFEEQCDMKLLTQSQKIRRSHFHKFNRASIHRTDLQTTTSSLALLVTHRIMSPNEARAKLDLNPYEGGDEFANPAITPGAPQQDESESDASPEEDESSEDDASEDAQEEQTQASAMASRAVEETIRSLIKTEANNAIAGAKSKNFGVWINKNYPKWESKLAEKLEALGIDRDLATKHCQESVDALCKIAAKETSNLPKAIAAEVAVWTDRTFNLMGINK
jgi:HK97 family phage portal protein